METASVTEAKNNLSKLLKKVRHGATILILDRNVPVARLEPLPAGSTEAAEAHFAELERQGLIKMPRKTLPKDFWDRPLPKLKGSLVKTLLKERAEAPW